jgi:bifunctional non-homologous end joining protein LigD
MPAAKTSCPPMIRPQLVTMVAKPPPGEWLYEIKYDGYRMMARLEGGVTLYTKNGYDWTKRMPTLAREFNTISVKSAWIDGEVVVQDEEGRPVFQPLQSAFSSGKTDDLVYFAFDLLFLNGQDLRAVPVQARREKLRRLLERQPLDHILFSQTLDVDPDVFLANACKMGLEGIVGKRSGSPYASERNGDWVKIKCNQRQEFVVLGYTRAAGGIGSLLIGLHDDSGNLSYAGRVKSGFSSRTLTELRAKFSELERPSAVTPDQPDLGRGVRPVWLEPVLVCEVKFAEITPKGRVRHAVFMGMRDDKPATGISLESSTPDRPPEPTTPKIRITHGDRVIDPSSGLTKGELVAYYARVAPHMLPLLENRPVSLTRAPDGIEGEQFFQRSVSGITVPGMETIKRESGKSVMVINNEQALVGAAQMGSIEIHGWNATGDDLSRPDRFILDLDPDPSLPWVRMIEATQLVTAFLSELGLVSFLKTSGGKGIHIVVPLSQKDDWASVKAFSLAVVKYIAKLIPERFTAVSGPKNRVGRIFIDYLRNSAGATTVSAYSVRARPGLPVSVPIWPDELLSLQSANAWTIKNVFTRLDAQVDDPWAAMPGIGQVITKKMRNQLGMA